MSSSTPTRLRRFVRARPIAMTVIACLAIAVPAVASTSHAGWPPKENVVTENVAPGTAATLVGKPNVHNYLLGKYGNDTFIGGNDGDVIWADERPTGAPAHQKAIIHAGNGKNFIYSTDAVDEVWTGTNPATVVHAHSGSGVIHCENAQIIVYTSHRAKPHYKFPGCKRISFKTVGY
jgi:hypothetical protein